MFHQVHVGYTVFCFMTKCELLEQGPVPTAFHPLRDMSLEPANHDVEQFTSVQAHHLSLPKNNMLKVG